MDEGYPEKQQMLGVGALAAVSGVNSGNRKEEAGRPNAKKWRVEYDYFIELEEDRCFCSECVGVFVQYPTRCFYTVGTNSQQ